MAEIKFEFNVLEFNVRGTIITTKLSHFKNSGIVKDYLNKKGYKNTEPIFKYAESFNGGVDEIKKVPGQYYLDYNPSMFHVFLDMLNPKYGQFKVLEKNVKLELNDLNTEFGMDTNKLLYP